MKKKLIKSRIPFHLVLLLSAVASSAFAFGQDSDCLASIRIGKFVSVTEGGDDIAYTVNRKKKKQIETFNDGKSKIVSKIVWVNDSTYTLTTIKIKNAEGCDRIGAVATVTILNCTEEIQTCRWKQKGCGQGITRLRKVSAQK